MLVTKYKVFLYITGLFFLNKPGVGKGNFRDEISPKARKTGRILLQLVERQKLKNFSGTV